MSSKARLARLFGVCLSVVLILFFKNGSEAQIPTPSLENRLEMDSLAPLEFRLGLVGYVKNNEYFNPHVEGYTLWGMQVAPMVMYRISAAATLAGGVFWRNDFGETAIALPEPIISLKLTHHNWNYLFGTIEGNLNHRLVEPLYNFERYLRTPIENGLQINHIGQKHFFDFWISYPRNTLPGYRRQEQFWGGLSTLLKVVARETFSGSLIAQSTVFHAGGQGIQSPLPVTTSINSALGFRANLGLAHGWVDSIRLEPYLIGYFENSGNSNSGMAWYINATAAARSLTVMLSYWQGSGYRSVFGGDLYISDSRSVVTPTYYEKKRNWLMLRLIKTIDLRNGLTLSGRFEPMYDFQNRKFEHSEGIYIAYALRRKIQKN